MFRDPKCASEALRNIIARLQEATNEYRQLMHLLSTITTMSLEEIASLPMESLMSMLWELTHNASSDYSSVATAMPRKIETVAIHIVCHRTQNGSNMFEWTKKMVRQFTSVTGVLYRAGGVVIWQDCN